jgi:hypothetical protein
MICGPDRATSDKLQRAIYKPSVNNDSRANKTPLPWAGEESAGLYIVFPELRNTEKSISDKGGSLQLSLCSLRILAMVSGM